MGLRFGLRARRNKRSQKRQKTKNHARLIFHSFAGTPQWHHSTQTTYIYTSCGPIQFTTDKKQVSYNNNLVESAWCQQCHPQQLTLNQRCLMSCQRWPALGQASLEEQPTACGPLQPSSPLRRLHLSLQTTSINHHHTAAWVMYVVMYRPLAWIITDELFFKINIRPTTGWEAFGNSYFYSSIPA